ncbi:unnamed protein product [Acanthoscelides obtectus]|uniref:HMG box domain-containing protein n=1 Tax=Acanthoscelides obtectus TaxID=200917 RepID=A0A9P0LH29_ACAOB|nr:unnamed protein product [Acanthoscelides obtectus]CAK1635200.1 hypothetical protein AOBTE_LOCUS9132 [Acanthoscelides obtectus]
MDQSRARSRSRSARGGRTPRRQSVPPDVRISRASINPFLNFLADYRKSNTQGLSMKDLAQKGAKLWREMSQKEKEPYIRISKEAQIYRKASKGRRKGRKSRRRRRGSKDDHTQVQLRMKEVDIGIRSHPNQLVRKVIGIVRIRR